MFLWVFLGAPNVGTLHQRPALSAALTAITAAVVGVILNLGVTFGLHALRPVPRGPIDWFIALLAVAAFLALQRFKLPLLPIMACCAIAGMAWHLAF